MLLYKKVPHNFEVHYEDKMFETRPIQFLDLDSDYVSPAFKDILMNYESLVFDEWWGEIYNTNKAGEDFSNLTVCEFKSFFKEINIDTPRCFSNSHSLKRNVNKYYIYKLNNYFMRSGKSMKTYLLFLKAMHSISLPNQSLSLTSYGGFSWINVYSLLANINVSNTYSRFSDNIKVTNYLARDINELGIEYNNQNDYRLTLMENFKLLEPMFLFYIYKVDKNIYKNSRGRSGKFTFLWKYVAPYKRRHIVMAWLIKESKMQPGRDLYSRLNAVLVNAINNPSATFMSKIRKFSYNYVYYNCRRTLAETYRTSTK